MSFWFYPSVTLLILCPPLSLLYYLESFILSRVSPLIIESLLLTSLIYPESLLLSWVSPLIIVSPIMQSLIFLWVFLILSLSYYHESPFKLSLSSYSESLVLPRVFYLIFSLSSLSYNVRLDNIFPTPGSCVKKIWSFLDFFGDSSKLLVTW